MKVRKTSKRGKSRTSAGVPLIDQVAPLKRDVLLAGIGEALDHASDEQVRALYFYLLLSLPGAASAALSGRVG